MHRSERSWRSFGSSVAGRAVDPIERERRAARAELERLQDQLREQQEEVVRLREEFRLPLDSRPASAAIARVNASTESQRRGGVEAEIFQAQRSVVERTLRAAGGDVPDLPALRQELRQLRDAILTQQQVDVGQEELGSIRALREEFVLPLSGSAIDQRNADLQFEASIRNADPAEREVRRGQRSLVQQSLSSIGTDEQVEALREALGTYSDLVRQQREFRAGQQEIEKSEREVNRIRRDRLAADQALDDAQFRARLLKFDDLSLPERRDLIVERELRPARRSLSSDEFARVEGGLREAAGVVADDELDDATGRAERSAIRIRDAFANATQAGVGSLVNGINQLIDGTSQLDAVLQQLATTVASALLQQGISAGIGALAGGGNATAGSAQAAGGIFSQEGLSPFQRGAAFSQDGITPFQRGGVFGSPTLFRFGREGRLGMLGEAGPEAILPLRRGADGKLGVQSGGSGGISRDDMRLAFRDALREAGRSERRSGNDSFRTTDRQSASTERRRLQGST